MIAFGAALMSGCSKEDPMVDPQIQNDEMSTLTKASEYYWTCNNPICNYSLNSHWRNNCVMCGMEYNAIHGQLMISLKYMIEKTVGMNTNGGEMNDGSIANRVELPGKLYLAYGPSKWYETATAKRYYTDITKTLVYASNPDYAEGFEYAWYRTVRMLYPNITNHGTAQRTYDKFIVGEGRNLKGQNGSGIKAATQAAINAYGAYK